SGSSASTFRRPACRARSRSGASYFRGPATQQRARTRRRRTIATTADDRSDGAMTVRHLANAVFHTLRICVPTVIQSALGTLTTPTCDARLDSWSASLVRYAKIELDVSGLEHAPLDEAFVVMSNHRSHYDIPVLFQALRPRRLRMVAKAELFRV